jgi:hypothetical protein
VQSEKHRAPMILAFNGIPIDWSDERAKACHSTILNDDGDSHETDESAWQLEKQDESRLSTLDGITIDLSKWESNVSDSMFCNIEPGSNETADNDAHSKVGFQTYNLKTRRKCNWFKWQMKKAEDSIAMKEDGDSNEIDETGADSQKQ